MDSLVDYTLITNEIRLVNHHIEGGKFSIDPQLRREIKKIDDSKSAVTYYLEICNSPEKPFPIDLSVSITGIFDVSHIERESVDDFLQVQTCQILFPQIRTIVANLTASALMPPILLPVIDARKLFLNEEKE